MPSRHCHECRCIRLSCHSRRSIYVSPPPRYSTHLSSAQLISAQLSSSQKWLDRNVESARKKSLASIPQQRRRSGAIARATIVWELLGFVSPYEVTLRPCFEFALCAQPGVFPPNVSDSGQYCSSGWQGTGIRHCTRRPRPETSRRLPFSAVISAYDRAGGAGCEVRRSMQRYCQLALPQVM